MPKRPVLKDFDGTPIKPGCALFFTYGIPGRSVRAQVIERDGALIALTPGHNPAESPVTELLDYYVCTVEPAPRHAPSAPQSSS